MVAARRDEIMQAAGERGLTAVRFSGQHALEELTRAHEHHHRAGPAEYERVQEVALLDQLQEAITTGNRMSGGARAGGYAPLAVNALDLWEQIRGVATAEVRNLGGVGAQDPRMTVRSWWALAQHGQEDTAWAEHWLTRWCGRIRVLLDPPARREIPKPCPECRASWILAEDLATGQRIRQRALLLEGEWIVCRNRRCLSAWPATEWVALAKRLGTFALREDTPAPAPAYTTG